MVRPIGRGTPRFARDANLQKMASSAGIEPALYP